MKILHTSDWHIGRSLYGRKRYDEFEAFLAWLADTMEQEQVDALLVAGDVFDNSTPSNYAQALYYRFLCRIARSECRHVVVIAGNHDSPSFLNAPRELLQTLNVHIVGSISENSEDEVLVLNNKKGVPELIVCAIPYLRDRDIRVAETHESIEDKERKLLEGIRIHYHKVIAIAEKKRDQFLVHMHDSMQAVKKTVPIVAMGHLFAAGGKTVEGDGVRELYVGSLAHVSAAIFSDSLDYVALGHLHVPQKVGGSEIMRYSGSPLPMGFGEAKQQKSVCLIEMSGLETTVKLIEIPVFQKLARIRGNWQEIEARIAELANGGSQVWLEVIYDGIDVIGDLRERLEAAISGTQIEILRVKNNRIIDRVLGQIHDEETLDDLNVSDVFERCLAVHDVPDEQRPDLLRIYQETVAFLFDNDAQSK